MIKVMCNDTHATGAEVFVISLHPTRFPPIGRLKREM